MRYDLVPESDSQREHASDSEGEEDGKVVVEHDDDDVDVEQAPKTLKWHRDNYPRVDSASQSYFETTQIVKLICERVGVTSLKR
jgi:hypothetical protein